VLHAGREHRIAHFTRRRERDARQRGPAVALFKRRRDQRAALRGPFVEGLGVLDARGRHDLAIDAAHAHRAAARALREEAPRAADSKIDFAFGQRPAVRAEPALEERGRRQRLEDEIARCVEDARHDDLAIAARFDLERSGVLHRVLLSVCVCAASAVP
jgi:hypothetical protein